MCETSGMLREALDETERAIALAREQKLDPNYLQVATLEPKRLRLEEGLATREE